MSKNVLVVGGGGREHAITWKIAQSEHVKNIYALPGSVAISKIPKTKIVQGDVKNFKEIAYLCKDNEIDIVVVGPEDPLANGIGDYLTQFNIKVFGPCILGAQIESNKQWAKSFFNRHEIPTARWKAFYDAEEAKTFIQEADFNALVVKASGLAAGKGVVVAKNKDEACKAVDDILGEKKFGTAGETVVIEELLIGDEVSVLAFTDGTTVKPMLPAQDHKRIFDNDEGPNTGGMGAYCPCPLITQQDLEYVTTNILQKTVDGLKKEKIPYVGVLYAGLMLTPNGIKILEYNCRFGDPETEVILPLLETDLYEIMENCCNGTLHQCQIRWKENLTAVGVVMASRGYPETSSKGQVITGLENVDSKSDHIIFHCGTQFQNGNYVTNGGRVLIVVALASQLSAASFNATKSCDAINFDGRQFRKDIAHKGIVRSILTTGKLTYKDSGVDISAGNDLVEHIKPVAKSTDRSGVMGSLGGFGGLFDLKNAGFHDPLLVSGTDGVGTKLKIAQEVGIHNTIGIDLVAMCVNDVLAHGAEPLFFLDYFACGQLDVDTAKNVVSGVGEGCRRAGCSLIGGETAEMPDMYKPGEYDVAGFAVGAVERNSLIPKIAEISPNDIVIGLSSSGVHSNGLSLVRKVVELSGVPYSNVAPFSKHGKTLGEEILTPTHIYVKPVLQAVKTGKVKAFAHITGGGLLENVPRVLPKHLGVELDAFKWNIPEIFAWLAVQGQINVTEMLRTFNCGIGGILIVNPQFADEIMKLLPQDIAQVIGKVNVITSSGAQVIVQNFCEAIELKMRPYLKKTVSRQKKRVGVLISGSGTNLQALIDAKGPDSEIVLVISNKDDVEGLRRAQRAGIKTKVIKHKDFPTREAYDAVLDASLIAEGVEIVCLAGFMRILSSFFTNKWRGRLLNVHPALLPAFKGVRAQKQALDAGVRVAGCTVHFVEADVDAGAIIAQEAVPVEINETEESLIEKIKLCEHKIFPHALQLVASGKVRLESDGTLAWSI